MQFTRAGMGVMNSGEAMTFKNGVELPYESRQILWIDSSIFDYRHRFRVSGDVGKQAQSRFTQIPNPVLVLSPDNWIMISKTSSPQIGLKTFCERCYFLARISRQLNRKDC